VFRHFSRLIHKILGHPRDPNRRCPVNIFSRPKLVGNITKPKSRHSHPSDVPLNSDKPNSRVDNNCSQIHPAEDKLYVGDNLQNIAVLHVLEETPKSLSSYIVLQDDVVMIDRVVDEVDLGR